MKDVALFVIRAKNINYDNSKTILVTLITPRQLQGNVLGVIVCTSFLEFEWIRIASVVGRFPLLAVPF